MAINYNDPKIIQDAKRKLSEMYAVSNTKQRIAIGRGMGYDKSRENADSARRSAERLSKFKIGAGTKLDITNYFYDIAEFSGGFDVKRNLNGFLEELNSPNDNIVWKGKTPSFTVIKNTNWQIVSNVVLEKEDIIGSSVLVESFINSIVSSNPEDCFESIEGRTYQYLEGTYIARDNPDGDSPYRGISQIGFSELGVQYLEQINNATLTRDIDENTGKTQFGVTLISTEALFTKTRLKKDRKILPRKEPVSTARDFPKSPKRRKEIIQYIRRAYPQRVK
jgi:hypothetical protein